LSEVDIINIANSNPAGRFDPYEVITMDSTRNLVYEVADLSDVLTSLRRIPDWPSEEIQILVADMIKDLSIYTPPRKWLNFFYKKILEDIEFNGHSLHDSLAEIIIKFKADTRRYDLGTSYVNYILENGSKYPVTCGILVSHNDMGLRVWSAGLYMCEYLLDNLNDLTGMKIVELGSGVGNTGLILAASKVPFQSFTFSDFSDDVLINIRNNITLNQSRHSIYNCTLIVQKLDWSLVANRPISELPESDVIIAADCCYSKELCDHLLEAICTLLTKKSMIPNFTHPSCQQSNGTIDHGCDCVCASHSSYALIACTVRNEETYSYLVTRLDTHPTLIYANFTEVASTSRRRFYYSDRDRIQLLRVSLRPPSG